jgi:hypothetical protein
MEAVVSRKNVSEFTKRTLKVPSATKGWFLDVWSYVPTPQNQNVENASPDSERPGVIIM